MKKTTIIAAVLVAVSFVSCRKERTCSCTYSMVDAGTSYTVNSGGQQSALYTTISPANTTEIKYRKVTTKYANEVCEASEVDVTNYDNTTTSGGYITGTKGAKTTTETCELK